MSKSVERRLAVQREAGMIECDCEWEKLQSGGMVSYKLSEYYSLVFTICPICGKPIHIWGGYADEY